MGESLYVPTWFEAEAALWGDLESIISEGIPFDHGQLLRNLRLFEVPSTVARVLWFQHLYDLVRDVPGNIVEFGVLWGGDMVLWDNLRTVNEPGMLGSQRGLVGFDTFDGHVGTAVEDGDDQHVQPGAFRVPARYVEWFAQIMNTRHALIRSGPWEVVIGDVRTSLPNWLGKRPEQTIALAYLDLDLYDPTRVVLESIVDRIPTGGVIAFDEVYNSKYPGEAIAVGEVLGGWGRVHRWRGHSGSWCWWVKPEGGRP